MIENITIQIQKIDKKESEKIMTYIPGQNSNALAAEENTKEKLKKMEESKRNSYLKELGKVSAFKETFEGISLEEQEIQFPKEVADIVDIKTKEAFLEGRRFGFTLIKNGFNEINYSAYINATTAKGRR